LLPVVVAREGVVLNPHYQTLGLHGSEYWTYTLPRRVGEEKAYALTSRCLPISAAYAQAIGLVDTVLSEDDETYREELHRYCFSLCEDDERYDELLDAKRQKSITPLLQRRFSVIVSRTRTGIRAFDLSANLTVLQRFCL
jgi:putative two-component system hydrogenase maturation factor HypX/HoxX